MFYPVPVMHGDTEIEAKWRADDREHERLRATLRQAEATHLGTVRERNLLFDTADEAIRSGGQLLRVRELDDGQCILTFKGPATYDDGIKTREETELSFTDRDAMMGILNGIGFRVTLEYEKTRESWDCNGALVALDTLEFGRFVEIEGSADEIRNTAELLALDMEKVERHGYPSMMRAHQSSGRAD